MKKTLIGLSILVLFVLNVVYAVKTKNEIVIKSDHRRGELVVAFDADLPGYFVLNGIPYGYQYDLLNDYAQHLGLELKVVTGTTVPEALDRLRRAQVDMVATTPEHIGSQAGEFVALNPRYNSTYVVLADKGTARKIKKGASPAGFIASGHKLILQQGFTSSRSYDELLDTLSGVETFVSMRTGLELMKALARGEADFVVCEKLEAQLGCALYPNLTEIHDFREDISLQLVVDKRNGRLAADFDKWLEAYRSTDEYAVLYSLYFEKDIVRQMVSEGYAVPRGSISPFDDLMKELCAGTGRDWRLISAIAYHESRFNPYVVSRRGATGIMQIMPAVARQFKVENYSDPKENIRLALKILDRIEKSLGLGGSVSDYDRMCLVLASYNAGIGHVIDARRLARKHGADPDSWQDVSFYLLNKTAPEYYDEQLVKSGRLRGNETLAFVDNVMHRYTAYCSRIQ